jgi:hypothetical protein
MLEMAEKIKIYTVLHNLEVVTIHHAFEKIIKMLPKMEIGDVVTIRCNEEEITNYLWANQDNLFRNEIDELQAKYKVKVL